MTGGTRAIGFSLADPALIADVLDPACMAVRGAFHPVPEDSVPALADNTPAGTLVLVGWIGGAQWPAFAASAEFADGQPDPLDRWTRRKLGAAATRLEAPGLEAMVLHPGDGPPFLPFQRWAMRAEGIAPSPLGLLIHPAWGLWHSFGRHLSF